MSVNRAPHVHRVAIIGRGLAARANALVDRVRRHPFVAALVVYALIGAIANLPAWPGDPTRIAACDCGGNKDIIQTAWFLAFTPYALAHWHNLFATSLINYPVGVDLAQNTGMPLLGLLAAPLTLAISPVASENLLRWLAFPLSAFATFFVLGRWLHSTPAAFVGGLLYGFSPYMLSQASVHLNLSFVPLPPLIFYAVYELVVRQEHSAYLWGLLLGALGAAQYFISSEILASTVIFTVTGIVLIIITHPRSVVRRAPHAAVGLLIGAGLCAAAIAYPAYLMTHGPLHFLGPSQGAHDIFNVDLLSPIIPTSAELVAPGRLTAIGSALVAGVGNVDENGSYLSIPLLLLLAFAVGRWWRRPWMRFAAVMVLVAFVLSLGDHLRFDRHTVHLPFELPFKILRRLPFLDDVLPSRLALFVTFFVALAISIALAEWLATRRTNAAPERSGARPRRARQRLGRGTIAVLALATVAALLPNWPYGSAPTSPAPGESSQNLAAIPPGSVVVTYPYTTPSTDEAMLWQALAGMRFTLIGSYALRRGPTGGATLLPSALPPYNVEAMLADPLAHGTVPIPGLPYLAPTVEFVNATEIVVAGHAAATAGRRPAVTGVVESINRVTHEFFVAESDGDYVKVRATPQTRYAGAVRRGARFRNVARDERVVVYGPTMPGTVDPRRVADLRSFLGLHHVDAVVVELGQPDSNLVVKWVSAALGPPSRARRGGDLWLDVAADLARRDRAGSPRGRSR
ncbi:MAG TPA: hypothetical protein VED84_08675 [Acidimicrobiales bacterium]|nr:hypothetical protein [Acidimicrobiales bacterium]